MVVSFWFSPEVSGSKSRPQNRVAERELGQNAGSSRSDQAVASVATGTSGHQQSQSSLKQAESNRSTLSSDQGADQPLLSRWAAKLEPKSNPEKKAEHLWIDVGKNLQDTVWGRSVRSPSPEISDFLYDVLGDSADLQSVQGRDAILAEDIRTVQELQQRVSYVADLVNMGVPLPQARKLHRALLVKEKNRHDVEMQMSSTAVEGDEVQCEVQGLVNVASEDVDTLRTSLSETHPGHNHSAEKEDEMGAQEEIRDEFISPASLTAGTDFARRIPFTEIELSAASDTSTFLEVADKDSVQLKAVDDLVEPNEEFQEWLRSRKSEHTIPYFKEKRILDFTALKPSKGTALLLEAGLSPETSEQMLEQASRMLKDEEEELKYASSHKNNRCLQEAADAFKNGFGSWNEAQIPAMLRLERAWAGISASTQLVLKHVSSQADDFASARALGLSFDDAMLASALRLETAEGGCLDDTIAKVSFSSGNATALCISMRPGCTIHSFQFVIHSLSKDGTIRLGIIQEKSCDNLEVNGIYKLGDCCSSWALSSGGNIVHNGMVHGPHLDSPLKAGDTVQVVYYQHKDQLRFLVNDEIVGMLLNKVKGPCVPAVTVGGQTKCLIQIQNYWGY